MFCHNIFHTASQFLRRHRSSLQIPTLFVGRDHYFFYYTRESYTTLGRSGTTLPKGRYWGIEMVGDRYFLVSQSGETIEIASDTSVGRGSDCDLTVDNTEVSRHHAQFRVTDEGVSLEDMKSANGSFIQGESLEGTQLLHHGDKLRFGPCVFEFSCESAATEEDEGDVTTISPPSSEPAAAPLVAEIAAKSDEDGSQGSIEVMPRNKNLPPAWVDDGPSHTVVFSLADVEKMASGQDEEELAEWEAKIEGPTLLILSGKDAGQPYKLQNSGELSFWTIGKGGASHDLSIIIDDPSVSDYHAKLVHKEGRWKIIDQMSTNHTYVNGEQYNSAFLSPKDSIRFGGVNAMFLMPQAGAAAGPVTATKEGFFSRLKRFFGGS